VKRKTKEQRDTEAQAALRRRVHDIACGAAGYQFDAEGEWATAEFLSRFVPALKAQFGESPDPQISRDYLWRIDCLNHYDNIDTAADFLFENGVRA
jgi:hypothetical protein